MSHHGSAQLPDSPIGAICGRLYELLVSGQAVDSDPELWLFARLVTELPWAGPNDRDISRARREIDEWRTALDRLRAENAQLDRRVRRLQTELRLALHVVDSAVISESLGLHLDRDGVDL
jgi:hypothetical protein